MTGKTRLPTANAPNAEKPAAVSPSHGTQSTPANSNGPPKKHTVNTVLPKASSEASAASAVARLLGVFLSLLSFLLLLAVLMRCFLLVRGRRIRLGVRAALGWRSIAVMRSIFMLLMRLKGSRISGRGRSSMSTETGAGELFCGGGFVISFAAGNVCLWLMEI